MTELYDGSESAARPVRPRRKNRSEHVGKRSNTFIRMRFCRDVFQFLAVVSDVAAVRNIRLCIITAKSYRVTCLTRVLLCKTMISAEVTNRIKLNYKSNAIVWYNNARVVTRRCRGYHHIVSYRSFRKRNTIATRGGIIILLLLFMCCNAVDENLFMKNYRRTVCVSITG